MKHYLGLVLVGLSALACSPSDESGNDLGGMNPDLGAPPDLGPARTMLNLIAGGLGGAGNADGTGNTARLFAPNGMTVDGAGNVYFADTNNHTIRKLVVASGVVTTIAGTAGMLGSQDGVGTGAQFNGPRGVAVDASGNLFITDSGNATIRKMVLSSGMVTTLAGMAGTQGSADGTGGAARFAGSSGLALDAAGNLYVADSSTHIIRKVTSAGVVTTLAGTAGMTGSTNGTGAAARFNQPNGVAVDGAGNVYVADTLNNVIRRVTSAGVVTTLAGTAGATGTIDGTGAAARFGQPLAVTVSGAGNLFVADSNNNTIRQVVIATGVVTTLAGGAGMPGSVDGTGNTARFSNPTGVAVDGAGNLFVADNLNQTIRQVVTSSGVTTTIAGAVSQRASIDGTGTAARFNQPQGVAMDGAGNLFIADNFNHTIRQVVIATGVVTTLAGTAGTPGGADGTGAAARFRNPRGMVYDGAGNLFVADTINSTLRKVVIASGVVTTVAGAPLLTGSTDGIGPAARFLQPQGIAVDGAGNLFVSDTGNHTIRQVVVATGTVSTIAGTPGMAGSTDGTGPAARFFGPRGLAADGAGNVFVADTNNSTIRKVVITSGVVSTLAGMPATIGSADGVGGAARFRNPSGVAFDGAGNLFVADTINNAIRQIGIANATVTTVVGVAGKRAVQPGPLPASLNQPFGITTSPTGPLYFTDTIENCVLEAR